jgi:hypothetical protein
MQRCRVTIVDAEPVKGRCKRLDVGCHVRPEPRVVVGSRSIPQLDAVTPDDDLAPEVAFGRKLCEVLERIGRPNPSVVRKGVHQRIGIGRRSKPCKVRFNKRRTRIDG